MVEPKKKRILVVEDERAYSRALVLKLNNAGFQAEAALNGEAAVELLSENNFDLVLCDIIMPKMNGFQLLETMKTNGNKTPVVMLSNLSQTDDEKKVRELGAVDFISKANTPIAEVISKIQQFLTKK